MNLLIFGGTGFLGRHLVESALNREHRVTLFNRGLSHPELFPDLEQIRGDRAKDLHVLQGRQWDAVIDTCGQAPRVVRASAMALADGTSHYTFISSTSVYADFHEPGIDEQSPITRLPDGTTEEEMLANYSAAKVLCEQAVEEVMAGHTLIIRPGLIVGPQDATDRFTYWPHRVAQGGDVLAPGQPDQPVQFIDVRDLAAWIVRMVEAKATGIYNAKGPAHRLTMGRLLEECKTVSRSNCQFVWASEQFLLQQHVIPYLEMPLWVPRELAGFATVNCSKAIAAGLTFCPLSDTIRATLAWDATRLSSEELRAGLKQERESRLLQLWHQDG